MAILMSLFLSPKVVVILDPGYGERSERGPRIRFQIPTFSSMSLCHLCHPARLATVFSITDYGQVCHDKKAQWEWGRSGISSSPEMCDGNVRREEIILAFTRVNLPRVFIDYY